MTKEETSPPTVAMEDLLLTFVIDAIERRDVAQCDIPGAFMQSIMENGTSDEKVTMKLEGLMVQIILKIDPKLYEKICDNRTRETCHICHT